MLSFPGIVISHYQPLVVSRGGDRSGELVAAFCNLCRRETKGYGEPYARSCIMLMIVRCQSVHDLNVLRTKIDIASNRRVAKE